MTTTSITSAIEPTVANASVAKRPRRKSVILTNRMCEQRVTERVKIYDRKCPGLYVSIIPAGTATLNFKFTDPTTGKQRSTVLGVYNPETFIVEDARSRVYALKAMVPAELVAQLHQTKAVKTARQDGRRDHRRANRLDEDAGPQGGRRNAPPDRELGKCCAPFAQLP